MRDTMLVTCTGCPVRGSGCPDCLITALYAVPAPHSTAGAGEPPERAGSLEWAQAAIPLPLDSRERRAVAAMEAAGLLAPGAARAAHAAREPFELRANLA